MRPFGSQQSQDSGQYSAGPADDDGSLVRTEATNAPSRAATPSDDDELHDKASNEVVSVAKHDAKYRRATLGAAKLIFGENVERVHIDTCRVSNSKVASLKNLVVIFVGGTGGIGESTCRELFRRASMPRAYIIGRSKEKADALIRDVKELNPAGQATFIECDVSLLKNVDQVCRDLQQREKKINCLFLTCGYMSTQGRNETVEGLDRKMVVNYYCRVRFTLKLMPQLTAASDSSEISRVISVFAAGSEGDIALDDLELRRSFSLHACLAHCVLLNDFMVEELAKKYPGTAFSHSYPGTVKTGIANELPGPARLVVKLLYALMTPWIMNVQESGERHLFQITSQCYPPAGRSGVGIEVPEGMSKMKGMDGERGSGGYLLDWDGKSTGDEKIITKYRNIEFGKTAWEHTMQMFESAERAYHSTGDKRPASRATDSERKGSDPVGWRPG